MILLAGKDGKEFIVRLSSSLDVSPVTGREDLKAWEDMGSGNTYFIVRIHDSDNASIFTDLRVGFSEKRRMTTDSGKDMREVVKNETIHFVFNASADIFDREEYYIFFKTTGKVCEPFHPFKV